MFFIYSLLNVRTSYDSCRCSPTCSIKIPKLSEGKRRTSTNRIFYMRISHFRRTCLILHVANVLNVRKTSNRIKCVKLAMGSYDYFFRYAYRSESITLTLSAKSVVVILFIGSKRWKEISMNIDSIVLM